jgi:hypothetical protein
MNCPTCGQVLLTSTRFCSNCGTPISAEEDRSPVPVSRTILDQEPVPYLLLAAGPGRGQAFDLRGKVYLGRSQVNTITISDAKVSRSHARLDPVRNTYILTDLGSANGTYVNGVRIAQPIRLRDGDLLQVGDTQLVFHSRSSTREPRENQPQANAPFLAVPTIGSAPAGGNSPVAGLGSLNMPTWVWAGCAGLLIILTLVMIAALAAGILIGQSLVGG